MGGSPNRLETASRQYTPHSGSHIRKEYWQKQPTRDRTGGNGTKYCADLPLQCLPATAVPLSNSGKTVAELAGLPNLRLD